MNQPRKTGITITQYGDPTLHFDTAEEYGRWLLEDPGNPDHAVHLGEIWDDPSYEDEGTAIVDAMFDAVDA